ncbi:B12-binding domain-containing radical SAM protein [Magnetospirillum sp. UT-4]|uniref:B12-binding domain-containing radical SAM protein n=1 Tax=Magnetospirillum sp. UT-4 TaxID=2681467 RepID=UPI001381C661|nr:radical SAM protein [Magnetospirillum sp. UT-4]CAA7621673.1 conserved hypothetical protein [Magnetospirillum sp. UT-4]
MKPKVFLADLIHNQRIYNYCVPLNVGCVAAKVASVVGTEADIRVFKFPDLLLEALEEKPDILALSNYDWNINLNRVVIAKARALNPDVFVVMGGPNVRRGEAGCAEFLRTRRDIDAYVMNEGEEAFTNIVLHLLSHPGSLRRTLIGERVSLPQVGFLDADGAFVTGGHCPSASANPITHPSPWLTGWMDGFMDVTSFPLSPIVETTRGCPYKCTYCTAWGTAATGTKSIRQYPLETVFAELDYIFSRSKNPFYLFLGDANIGILERDLEIVAEVRRLADTYRNVVGVGLDSSKNMVKRNIEIYRILGDLCIPTFAQQTFNIDVSEHIGRRNVSLETVRDLVATVHGDGERISTDLLVGLPTESRRRHVDSIKVAFDCGFDKLQISDIRLLKGTEMEEDYQRERYGLKSKVRIIPNAFGVYGGAKAIDYEHCIRETADMSEEDFLELRLFHAHMFVCLNLEIGRPLLDFSTRHGLHAIDLLEKVSRSPDADRFPRLAAYFRGFIDQARSEWFDDEDGANAHYFDETRFAGLMRDGFPKLNYDYASRLAIDAELKADLFGWMSAIVKRELPALEPALIDEVAAFSAERVMLYPFTGESRRMRLSAAARAELGRYIDGGGDAAAEVELSVDDHNIELFRKNLEQFGASNSVALAVQLVLQYSNKALLRSVRPALPTAA